MWGGNEKCNAALTLAINGTAAIECEHGYDACPICDSGHVFGATVRAPWANSVPGPSGNHPKNGADSHWTPKVSGQFCTCGAWLGSLGLEPTPELYVEHIVECFRHVRRVLRDDATLWVNLGDSYAGSGKGPSGSNGVGGQSERQGWEGSRRTGTDKSDSNRGSQKYALVNGGKPAYGYKPKDLMMIPFRVAMALQADGWYLRSVIPWLKRNSMPESVTDRPSTSVEYLFLLSKQSRYFYDSEAVRVGQPVSRIKMGPALINKRPTFRENLRTESIADASSPSSPSIDVAYGRVRIARRLSAAILQIAEPQNYLSLFPLDSEIRQEYADHITSLIAASMPVIRRAATFAVRFTDDDITAEQFLREIYGLWITLPDGHRLIEAWRSPLLDGGIIDQDGNAAVGVENASEISQVNGVVHRDKDTTPGTRSRRNGDWFFESWQGLLLEEQNDPLAFVVNPAPFKESHFATFPPKLVEPMVKASSRPGDVILDPFGGAGTVGLVADRLGRNAVLIDLKPEYGAMATDRLTGDAPMFVQVNEAPA